MNRLVFLDLLHESIQQNASKACFHIKRSGAYQTWTYTDFHRDLNRLSSALKAKGIGKGCNVAVIGANSPEWVISYNAIMLTGGCTVPIDPNLPAAEIKEIIRLSESQIVFCSPVYLNLFREIKEKSGHLKEVVVLDPAFSGPELTFEQFACKGDPKAEAFSTAFNPDDPCLIVFTSGTTGKAKGAVLMQRNLTAVNLHGIPMMHAGSFDTMLAVLPLHHVFGATACIAAALSSGMDVVFVPVIKGPLILEAIRDKHVTVLPAVPQMLELFYENIMRNVKAKGAAIKTVFSGLQAVSASAGSVLGAGFRKKLFKTVHAGFGGSLRLFVSGGSSLKKRYFHGFKQLGFDIVEGYGLTETFGAITLCPLNDARLGSVGIALKGNEAKIDNKDKDGIGEICFRGTTVFSGYFRNEEATKAVFDADGWFHTGDLGRMTRDGFIYITGRIKDIIVLDSGKNVYPDELEDYYSASPMIEEIGVFGIQENGSEVAAAVVVPAKDIRRRYTQEKAVEIIYEEIIRIGKLLPSYKKIGNFIVSYTALPRTTTKKIKKPDLKQMYAAAQKSSAVKEITGSKLSFLEMALMETEEYTAIVRFISEISKDVDAATISPRSQLELDLKIDSLRKLDLIAMLENEFNITVPQEEIIKHETIADLATMVQDLSVRKQQITAGPVVDIKQRIAHESALDLKLPENHSLLFHFGAGIAWGLSKALWNLRLSGMENIAQSGSTIFVGNHASVVDICWLLMSIPWQVRRNTFTLGKKELLSIPILPFVINRINMIPVEREGDIVEALTASLAVLRNGKNLVVFPEGTRSRTGEIGPFKSGIGTLLIESNATIIPVRISSADKVWPSGKGPRLLLSTEQKPGIAFGAPITLQDLINQGRISINPNPVEIADAIRLIIIGMGDFPRKKH